MRRRVRAVGVAGSNPVTPTIDLQRFFPSVGLHFSHLVTSLDGLGNNLTGRSKQRRVFHYRAFADFPRNARLPARLAELALREAIDFAFWAVGL